MKSRPCLCFIGKPIAGAERGARDQKFRQLFLWPFQDSKSEGGILIEREKLVPRERHGRKFIHNFINFRLIELSY